MQLPTVSAIVVSYHSGPALRECLHALQASSNVTETFLVANGVTDDDRKWLDWFQSKSNIPFHIIEGQGNVGFSAGVNLGAEKATSECLLIINPDAVLRLGSIRALEAARQSGVRPCLVGGKLFYPDGSEQRGGRRELLTMRRAMISYFGFSKLEKWFPGLRDLHRENDPEPMGPVQMPVVSGALCYIHRDDFNAIDGFDEGYFLHVEDIDFCRRITDAGGEVIYTPRASALHYGSTSRVSPVFVEWNKAKGLSRYFELYAASPIERFTARSSKWLFALLLIGRSSTLRMLIRIRDPLRSWYRKATRPRKRGGHGMSENTLQPLSGPD